MKYFLERVVVKKLLITMLLSVGVVNTMDVWRKIQKDCRDNVECYEQRSVEICEWQLHILVCKANPRILPQYKPEAMERLDFLAEKVSERIKKLR